MPPPLGLALAAAGHPITPARATRSGLWFLVNWGGGSEL